MKAPLLPIRGKPESAALLDRGGRPTLREFLAGLEFDPTTSSLRLNGGRVTLQLAEADRILRRELIRQLGEDEARIFLLRRGFRMGQNDAAFVASSWPMLDRGDAFTAGTRLHMFSGIVRVETVHNDFDFARGRFSAEFLWHNSLEADEGSMPAGHVPGHAARPLCWQQLGYASGYASHFFGTLVVYKETACAAQGHRACRVIGKLAQGWGEDDPDVLLFRSRILPANPGDAGEPDAARKSPAPVGRAAGAVASPLLAPVQSALDLAARLPLPCLIAGRGNCGQDAAATHLATRHGAEALRIDAATCTPETLRETLARPGPARKRAEREAPVLLLTGAEALSLPAQAELASHLHGALASEATDALPRVILTAGKPLSWLAAHTAPALWSLLAPLALEMPALPNREDLELLAEARMQQAADRLGLPLPSGNRALWSQLPQQIADLDQLDGVLLALLVASQRVATLTPAHLTEALALLRPATTGTDDDWIAARLAAGGFSLPEHEARIRAMALAQTGGNLSAAARLLGITRPQLAYREQAGRGQD